MNYRTASKQQLLAERARLTNAYRRAEQRVGARTPPNVVGTGSGRNRNVSRGPQQELDQLSAQLEQIEAELKRREEREAAAPDAPADAQAPPA